MPGLTPRDGSVLAANHQQFRQCRTFTDAAIREAFWYKKALGLAKIAANQGHAASLLGLALGNAVEWV